MKIILASTSPRRKELFSQITTDFVQLSPGVVEKPYPLLTPKEKALQLSKDKCLGALQGLDIENSVIISCDTVVDIDGQAVEKPSDEKAAFEMLRALSGRSHYVHSGVSVWHKGVLYSFAQSTKVYFDIIPVNVILSYIKTDEPYDKAGGYAIQGFMSKFITKIKGNYHNVVGLPVQKLYKLLNYLNIV